MDKQQVDEKQGTTKQTSDQKIELPFARVDSPSVAMDQSGLKDLIEKNIKWSQIIYEQNKKIKSRLTWMVVGSYLRLALVLVPIILGIIYLPPLLNDVLGEYSSFLEDVGAANTFPVDVSKIISQFSGSGVEVQVSSDQVVN